MTHGRHKGPPVKKLALLGLKCGLLVPWMGALGLADGPFGGVSMSLAADQGSQTEAAVASSQKAAAATPAATIQAAPIEVKASAPQADPDPYALPPHAPPHLVKLRTEMDRRYGDYRSLLSKLLKDFEGRDLEAENGKIPRGSVPEGVSKLVAEEKNESKEINLMKQIETLIRQIEMSEAEFLQEKDVFLTHGQVQKPGPLVVPPPANANLQTSTISQNK